MTEIIDGKARAARLREDIAQKAEQLKKDKGVIPGLAVVIVGDDPASQVYVRNKGKQATAVGFRSFTHTLPAETTTAELLSLIELLNNDEDVDGILVQLPLPEQIDETAVIDCISPDKDVDGFHTTNVGRLTIGEQGFAPCTPLGCTILIKDCVSDLSGLHAVIVGRSNIVGKPMSALLLRENCTVTVAHSRTKDLPSLCRQADILVAAVGRQEMVKGDWIKPGAIVIDVGINRMDIGDGKTKLVGDVEFETASQVAGFITPVPGGVGPMTIACLLSNTLASAEKRSES